MGTWGVQPWGNDTAADWFDNFMETTKIRESVLATIEQDVEVDFADSLQEIRAATYVFTALGRLYIWPVEHYDDDLKKIIGKAKEAREKTTEFQTEEISALMDEEIAELESRLRRLRQNRGA